MVPRGPIASLPPNPTTAYSLSLLTEYTHTLDSLPLDLSRNFADLRELDAVLSSSMSSITHKIQTLTQMIETGEASKEQRLRLLMEIADEAARLKLGGEDKIRVACQAADNLRGHTGHLRALLGRLPGFDTAVLARRTTYPHVAVRSFMPSGAFEPGRRRRGGGSLLVSGNGGGGGGNQNDPSPAKRKRVPREEEVDVGGSISVGPGQRSPRKDRIGEGSARSRPNARKKAERAVSPSESILSVTSHVPPQPAHRTANQSHVGGNQNFNANNGINAPATSANNNSNRGNSTTNKRSRGANHANNNNGTHNNAHHRNSTTPHINETFPSTHESSSSRREAYDSVPPPSNTHHSIPHQYAGAAVYDIHHHPHPHATIPSTSDWAPSPQQLEGPAMPVARSASIHSSVAAASVPVIPNNASANASADADGDGGDNEGDGDDRTYCFCDRVSYGEMIACDDSQCEREWFHLACIGLDVPPEGRWFCETCLNKRNPKRSGRGGKRRATGSRAGAKST